MGKPKRRKPPGRPRHRWEDNIKMDLRQVSMDWIDHAKYRDSWQALVDVVMNLWVP
jgi:hypothetical protein